jgi:stage III sporulation protein AG
MSAEEEKISKKLCEMLRQVEGAGKVEVSVRLSGSTKEEYAVNTTTGKKTTQERDQTGGTRVITEDSSSGQLVMNRSGSGGEQPVVEREAAPQVAGVLVVAEGASEAKVKAKLFEATRVSLGIEPQKIMVLPMERR